MVALVVTTPVGPLVSLLMKKASSHLLDQYKVMLGMEEKSEILGRWLLAILDVIEDVEKGASQPGVTAWLEKLKKVSYVAIDVFDEFNYEALRRDAKKKGQHVKLGINDVVNLFPAGNPIVFRYRMAKKLHKIVKAMEDLVIEIPFGFMPSQQVPPSKQWRQTDSIMLDSKMDIISRSRDEEKKKIVNILTDEARNTDLLVLPIVGIGGFVSLSTQ